MSNPSLQHSVQMIAARYGLSGKPSPDGQAEIEMLTAFVAQQFGKTPQDIAERVVKTRDMLLSVYGKLL